MDNQLLERITINQEVNNGRPSIRNMRFTVSQLLELLAAGSTQEEVLEEYPYLKKEDIAACLYFAAQLLHHKYSS